MLSTPVPRSPKAIPALLLGGGALLLALVAQGLFFAQGMHEALPAVAFVLPVALASWRGGAVPGLVIMIATVLGFVAAGLVLGPDDDIHVIEVLRLVSFVIVSVLVIMLFEGLWAARRRIEKKQGQLRRSSAFHQAIAELSSDFAFAGSVLPDGRIDVDDLTDGFEKLLGHARRDVMGPDAWKRIVHADDLPLAMDAVERLARGETAKGRLRLTAKSGRIVTVEYLARAAREPGADAVRLHGAARDVSEEVAALRAIEEAQERLQMALRAASMVAWTWDPESGDVHRSSASLDVLGRPAEDDKLRMDLVHEDDRERQAAALQRVARGEGELDEEIRLLHPDGREQWVASKGRARREPGTGRVQVVGVAIDVTARRKAEEERRLHERLYQALGDSIDFGVWVCDADGRNIHASASLLELLGITQAEAAELGWAAYLHPDDASETLAAWEECVRTRCAWDREHRFLGRDGRYHPVLSRGVPVRDDHGRVTHWVGIHLDMSRLKAAEDELQAASRRKDEFLATLAHELRNPLAPIRNAVAVLSLTEDPAALIQAREIIERQVQQMVRLVDDLLDVGRIASGRLELRRQPITLAEIVGAARETARPAAEAAGVRLELRLPPQPIVVNADGTRMAQVVANLLHNAIRHTPADRAVTVAAAREGDSAVITVEDEGAGISPETLPRIFDMFTQGEPAAGRPSGGLGVGLAIVKRLVEMHHGSVTASSGGRGLGSRFVVTIPASDGQAGDASVPAPVSAPPARRVLVVDDNADSAASLAMMLRLLGHDPAMATDGFAAIDACERALPEIVLLDIGMPGLDGYEVAKRLRARHAGSVVLVALTGWGQEADRRRSAEAGFDHHFVKPVDLARLRSVLEEA